MSSELLKCIICPLKPSFSDISHLLTHVGSKGHLSHLHRLQVRSHQEFDAANQLSAYNRWYQEHGMAPLLSERMLQKEQKKANKIAADKARLRTASGSSNPASQQLRGAGHVSCSSTTLLNLTPIRVTRDSSYPMPPSSPPKWSPGLVAQTPSAANRELDVKPSPGTPQLKGTQYPGMQLFDAASEQEKRKRNQKKDGSVLRRLERNSVMVLPRETVSSATGIVLKHRHMDDLENDSPVEGENLVRQPTPRRRKTLKPRAVRIKKEKIDKKPKKRRGRPRRQVETPSKGYDMSTDEAEQVTPGLPPIEDDSQDLRSELRRNGIRRKVKFAVYPDSSPALDHDRVLNTMSGSYVQVETVRPHLIYPDAQSVWPRQEPEAYDPFKLIRERFTAYPVLGEIGQGKENTDSFDGTLASQTHINSIFFQPNVDKLASSGGFHAAGHIKPATRVNIDPFSDHGTLMPARNPLMAALERLKPPKQESFEFDDHHISSFVATPYRQPVFVP